ncbi:MAG TPA: AAA family ATPase [Treponemataceae bacterium]|nr:AAA family ATPase [Treponemataceae bacterium]
MDLFDDTNNRCKEPLASRMRPRNLDEYIGQEHIVGKGRLLRRAIAADQLTSVIFYGPPGTGKTTLARVIANHTKSLFITLNAVLTGVQNIRDAIKTSTEQYKLYGKRTILFVDEVHRWSKNQQDALLPWVENGTIILVGATTENPFFEVNKALVSRSRVFQLHPLTQDDLSQAAHNALKDKERGYGRWKVEFEHGALEHLVHTANGDCRSLLNALELAIETTPEKWDPKAHPCSPPEGTTIFIDQKTAEESIQKKVVLYDRDGDYHFDIISAFIKSLRGRDPDAAMYWMARMLSAGEDPHYIFRRMLISACEDTGLADPHALGVVESCAATFDRIGLPEGRFMLTQAALYLATAPKSNSALCFFDALDAVKKENAEVPNHLKDPGRDAQSLGHGKGYMYPHAYKNHWVAQHYLPDSLDGRVFYNPSSQGYEATIQKDVLSRREILIATLLERSNAQENFDIPSAIEHCFYTSKNKDENNFRQQTDSQQKNALMQIRDTCIHLADIQKNDRCLILNADDGLFLWEACRACKDGATLGLCKTEKGIHNLQQYACTLGDFDHPFIMPCENLTQNIQNNALLKDIQFEKVLCRNPIATAKDIDAFAQTLKTLKEENFFLESSDKKTRLVLTQDIFQHTQRLSKLINTDVAKTILDAENEFYTTSTPRFTWNENDVQTMLKNYGTVHMHVLHIKKNRLIQTDEINRWLNPSSPYGKHLLDTVGEKCLKKFQQTLVHEAKKTFFEWETKSAVFIMHVK